MKLLVNTSNLTVGGGIQVALSFLQELKNIGNDQYFIFLSNQVARQLDLSTFPKNFDFFHFQKSPAPLLSRWQTVNKMKSLEKDINPDVVFSVFGPSYWRPEAPHVMGFALVWAINKGSLAHSTLNWKQSFKSKLLCEYHKYFAKKEGDFFIGETELVKQKMIKYKISSQEKTFVVSNTCHKVFDNRDKWLDVSLDDNRFRLITISSFYKHKNFGIIKKVVPFLEQMNVSCCFYLTLPQDTFNREFRGLENWVINLGPLDIRQCPSAYSQSQALFLPTLLECFSASYPEAMKMGVPILTSNLDFAHTICGDAAEYFDPLNAKDIAQKIKNLIGSKKRQEELIQLGKERFSQFPTAQERAESYLSICRKAATSA